VDLTTHIDEIGFIFTLNLSIHALQRLVLGLFFYSIIIPSSSSPILFLAITTDCQTTPTWSVSNLDTLTLHTTTDGETATSIKSPSPSTTTLIDIGIVIVLALGGIVTFLTVL